MWTFRRQLRYLGTPCLSFLLCAAHAEANAQPKASELLQVASPGAQLEPGLADEYQKLWSEVLKNARLQTGPRLKNPASASDGLAPGIVRVLQEQRNYLETHEAVALTRAPVNAAPESRSGTTPERSDHFPKTHRATNQ